MGFLFLLSGAGLRLRRGGQILSVGLLLAGLGVLSAKRQSKRD